jgi:hypothetical protein
MNFSQISVRFIFGITFAILCLVGALLFARSFQGETRVDLSRAAVIQKVQSLGNLETSSYTIEKVVEAGSGQQNIFQNALYGDKLLLIASGKVVAGFDLSTLTQESITVTGPEVTLRLGAPQVFLVSLDNSQTKVYDRRTGILNKGDKDLEAEARSMAEKSIRQAACEAGILAEATKN